MGAGSQQQEHRKQQPKPTSRCLEDHPRHQNHHSSRKRSQSARHATVRTPDDLSSIRVESEQEDPSEINNLSVSSHAFLEAFPERDDEDAASLSPSHRSLNSESSSLGVRQIAREETNNVSRWKTFVMLLLLVNAVLVTIATFAFMRREEEGHFEAAVRFIEGVILCIVFAT